MNYSDKCAQKQHVYNLHTLFFLLRVSSEILIDVTIHGIPYGKSGATLK